MVSIFDILITIGIAIQYAYHKVESKNMATFGFASLLITIVCSLVAVLAGAEARLQDVIIAAWYFCVPYLLMSVIPISEKAFITTMLEVTLIWFSVQMILGSLSVTALIAQVLGLKQSVAMGSYGALYRANNTLGGPTAGAHTACFLLAGYLGSSETSKRQVIVSILSLLGIVLCFSRSAWLEGIVIASWWVIRGTRRGSSLQRAIVSIMLVVGLLAVYRLLPSFGSRITVESSVLSDMRRQSKIESAIDSFVNGNRYLLGTGWGTGYVRSWIPVNTTPLLGVGWDPSLIDLNHYYLRSPHNTYLVILNEIGLIGSLLLSISFIYMVLVPIGSLRSVTFYCVVAALIAVMNTETVILHPKMGYSFVLMIWCGVVERKRDYKNEHGWTHHERALVS